MIESRRRARGARRNFEQVRRFVGHPRELVRGDDHSCAIRPSNWSFVAAVGLVPDAAARLPRALSRYTSGATPFAAWLLRVARNAALERRARRRRRRRRELTDQGWAPAPLAA